jgi:hypothetical protein
MLSKHLKHLKNAYKNEQIVKTKLLEVYSITRYI